MIASQKKEVWEYLREYLSITHDAIHCKTDRQSFLMLTRTINIRIRFKLVFEEMLDKANTNKEIRQAYRYAIAAGLFKPRDGKFQHNWANLNIGYDKIRDKRNERKKLQTRRHTLPIWPSYG